MELICVCCQMHDSKANTASSGGAWLQGRWQPGDPAVACKHHSCPTPTVCRQIEYPNYLIPNRKSAILNFVLIFWDFLAFYFNKLLQNLSEKLQFQSSLKTFAKLHFCVEFDGNFHVSPRNRKWFITQLYMVQSVPNFSFVNVMSCQLGFIAPTTGNRKYAWCIFVNL